MTDLRFDVIGYWSEVKLDIIRRYAAEYSKILAKQRNLTHAYIDAFAGGGVHLSRTSGELVPGSPLNVLEVRPSFRRYYFIDLDGDKVQQLRTLVGDRSDVQVFHGDCNEILLRHVFPQVRFEDYRRALCLLDPYGLHLSWDVIQTAGKMRSIDMFLNFPVMDMNRNVLWRHPDRLPADAASRLTIFWGDETWKQAAYIPVPTLFGEVEEKSSNEDLAESFAQRLRRVAGFSMVSKPLPMRNTRGAVVYYLFFASQKPVAQNIIDHIFDKYREARG